MDEFNQLRNLLLKDEQSDLESLKEKIKELDLSSKSPDLIIERITPLLTSIIKKSSIEDEEVLLETLTPVVFQLIDRNYEESKEKITKQLAPLITVAIREQIRSQKDEVVDALYPVLGNMISKFVSKTFEEMVNSINTQLTEGLSFKNLSRKVKAKIKGVSETELLLSENALASIRSVFLIHKETGIVLSHAEHKDNPINEPEMVASMMTAIRSFVNDWVSKNEAHHELGTIEYGGSKIIIEASGYSYLAVIVDGSVYTKTNERIRKVMELIVSKHWKAIKNFNGDMSTIPEDELHKKISTLIHKEEKSKESKKVHPLLYIIPFALISWLSWIFYNNYIDDSISSKANSILYKTPKLTIYRVDASTEDRILTLEGQVPSLSHKLLASKQIENIKNLKSIQNNIVIIEQEKKPKDITPLLNYLFIALNTKEGVDISFKYEKNAISIEGTVLNKNDKDYILKQIKTIGEINSIKDSILIKIPSVDSVIYFDMSSTSISLSQENKLIKLIALLEKLDEDLILEIKGFSDKVGLPEQNKIIAQKRAENIAQYLKIKGDIKQEVIASGEESLFEDESSTKYEHNRYVIFSLKSRSL